MVESIIITENGTTTAPDGKAYSPVTVNVPSKEEQAKIVDLNMNNGNQTIIPDTGKTLSSVTVSKPDTMIASNIKTGVIIGGVVGTAPIPKDEQEKSVDLSMPYGNQIISPDSGKVLSSVIVNKPSTLVSENIKSGVAIGGVTGTLTPAKPEETKTVALSMESGDQTITPTSGKVLTSVKVVKPSTLIAGNIKKDVNIGGVVGTYDPTDIQNIEWNQCPELVREYLANVTYDPSDYSTSQIANYAPATAVVSNYKPVGQEAGGVTHYNEVPNVLTPFAGSRSAGTLKPLDRLRWIRTRENQALAWNVRDIGGWNCDGGTTKYGLLIRGGKLGAEDRTVLVGELGIQHDLDLRGREGGGSDDEPEMTESPLGSDVWYTRTQQYAWYALTPVEAWQTYLRCVIDAVTHREPVYFHCTAGADRTGTLACVLEGLLGMSQSDIDKDYELTTFYSGSGSDATARRRNESDWKGLINAINAVSGDSFRDKCVHFAVGTCGMTMSDINAYRVAMIDGAPETLHWYQSITKNLTGCTISNVATQVEYGDSYTATVTPESGKTLDSIVVTMGGVDITSTAVSGGVISIPKVTGAVTITAASSAPSVNYNITRNLTNCASSNTADTIAEGASYTTTLSPTGTYKKLGTITVTMGGTDISSTAVSGSTITIPKVTGNIVIICAAEITNIIDTIGISANTRLSTSSGANRVQSGYAAIGANEDAASLIHLVSGDTLRIKGASLPASNDNYSAIVLYNASGAFNVSNYLHNGFTWNNLTFNNADGGVTITSGGDHYFRVSLICADASVVIATINEEIE